MDIALVIGFFTSIGIVLGSMARRAWRWTEPPALSTFDEGSYAASLPACLMSAGFVVMMLPIVIVGREGHALWAKVLLVVLAIPTVAFGVAMHSTRTYRKPRFLVPPALRRD